MRTPFPLSLLFALAAAGCCAATSDAAPLGEPLPGQIIIDPQHPEWLKRHGGGHVFICGPGDPEGFLWKVNDGVADSPAATATIDVRANDATEQTRNARTADAPGLGALPPQTVVIGSGGTDGSLAVGPDGAIHVIYGGKYRAGPASDALGREEAIAGGSPVHGVRLTIDAAGRPHVVFSSGAAGKATRSYYTTRRDSRWLPPEKFADAADFPERTRAYVADVAVDEKGHVLVSFWVSRPEAKRGERENPSFYYRWRTAEGKWSEPRSLPAHWSSAPKVEHESGRGFFLLWQFRNTDWRIAGPVGAGEVFDADRSVSTGSAAFPHLSTVQNEGADFARHGGVVIVAGNIREKFEGPVGVWATLGRAEGFEPAVYIGSFPETKRGDESGVHPVATWDAETGTAFVTVMNPRDRTACFTVHRATGGWQRSYTPLLPDVPAPQGTLRQGPSVADLPGPGVIALVRDGEQRWYLRVLRPEDTTEVAATAQGSQK